MAVLVVFFRIVYDSFTSGLYTGWYLPGPGTSFVLSTSFSCLEKDEFFLLLALEVLKVFLISYVPGEGEKLLALIYMSVCENLLSCPNFPFFLRADVRKRVDELRS